MSPSTGPDALAPAEPSALPAVERLARFARQGALQAVRDASREPRIARHFQRLDPFWGAHHGEEFGRVVSGFAVWLGRRLEAGGVRGQGAAGRLARLLGSVEHEVARYGRLAERDAFERFTWRAVEALELDEEDRWAGRMLLLNTLAEPLRERVEQALHELRSEPDPAPA